MKVTADFTTIQVRFSAERQSLGREEKEFLLEQPAGLEKVRRLGLCDNVLATEKSDLDSASGSGVSGGLRRWSLFGV